MLDCPSLGLAPIMVDRVTEAIIELKRRGIAILMVEQNVPFALNIADRGYIMEKGSIVSEGAADTLVELLSS
jgi:branched-chain amino acid transport system ATP-binding protein